MLHDPHLPPVPFASFCHFVIQHECSIHPCNEHLPAVQYRRGFRELARVFEALDESTY